MRVTRKMMNNNSVYNINVNKTNLDELNTRMASQKKYEDPSDDPITAVRSLRFRSNLSEVSQYLDRNVSDAVSWTESTASAIDTAKELMRSLKAEYTSAANGTNESNDQWIYYRNMKHLVDEYFDIGNTASEDRYIFTGHRTDETLTFTAKDFKEREDAVSGGKFEYKGIKEIFSPTDIERYNFTARKGLLNDDGATGVTDKEISDLSDAVNETDVENVQAYRMRLSYEEIDNMVGASLDSYGVTCIKRDEEINQEEVDKGRVYLNVVTGTLIFGDSVRDDLETKFSNEEEISFFYDKSVWHEGDVKPEYYFSCEEVGLGMAPGKKFVYNDWTQEMNYNVGDSQSIKVNTNACDVFVIDARRDLDDLYDYLTALDNAKSKVQRIQDMKADTNTYSTDAQQRILSDLYEAANKELEYATERVNKAMSNGMTRAESYFNTVNEAATAIGTSSKRLELIKNRLTADKTTVRTQTSDNENVDLSTLAVDVSEASLLYSAALQVTGKISQQSLVNYI